MSILRQVDVEWKAGTGPGELEGYASVFGNVDEVGDVVVPGAFRKTIEDWKRASQPMPLIADHQMSTEGVIGSIASLAEDRHGLRFKARFSRSDKAQRIRQDVIDRHYRGTSFTYEIIRSSPGRGSVAGKAVARFLDELRLFEITLSPFPVNGLAGVTSAKASTAAWGNFTAADYTPEQWRRACLIDTGQGEVDSKGRYKLPVREPSGALNVGGVHAAAGALAGARGGVQVSPDQRKAAARKLIRLYGEIGEEAPDSVRSLAGAGSSSLTGWLDSMGHAIGITDPFARKAALDELVRGYPDDLVADLGDAPVTTNGAVTAPEPGDTPIPDAAYAESFLHGPPDGAPTAEPPDALPGPIAALELERFNTQVAAIEAEINEALGKDPSS
jgi:HK97 family phage prohead protease